MENLLPRMTGEEGWMLLVTIEPEELGQSEKRQSLQL